MANTVTIFTHSIVEQLVQVPKGNLIGGQCVMKKELVTNGGRTVQYRLEIVMVRKKNSRGLIFLSTDRARKIYLALGQTHLS